MDFLSFSAISVQPVKNLYQPYVVDADVLRLDLLHPLVSGNKWFKLKEYISVAQKENKRTLLTFGGAYSNHILATAAAAMATGLNAIGIIRGERSQQLSSTLQEAAALGMRLYFISREEYKLKHIPQIVLKENPEEDLQIIDEGGYGVLGRIGVEAITTYCKLDTYTHIITAVGTGTTLAGLVKASTKNQKVVGISVLKNALSLSEEINTLLPEPFHNQFTLLHEYHFGGYAKTTTELFDFMNSWYEVTAIPIDFVYTGKAFFAADHLIRSHYFPKGSKILLIHSGGLQGNRSLPENTLIF